MLRVAFRKYHGLGNDFILFDGLRDPLPLDRLTSPAVVQALCDRHTGVGADGLLLVLPPSQPTADARMRILNADGSEPEMCGNGIRCVAKALAEDAGPLQGRASLTIETGAGLRVCEQSIHSSGRVESVKVDMGAPSLERADMPMSGAGTCIEEPLPAGDVMRRWTAVSMGNPHVVTFLEASEQQVDLRMLAETLGPLMERHAAFPRRTNVELVRFAGRHPDEAEVCVWERGCGITQACGTGACAVAVAASVTGRHPIGRPLRVSLPGGTLRIEVTSDQRRVWMEGPAREVFTGAVDLERLKL